MTIDSILGMKMKQCIAVILLLSIGMGVASENLTWLEGRQVTYLESRWQWSDGFKPSVGTVGGTYENFVYIEEIDTWIQSNWIWSVRMPEIRRVAQ